MQRQRQIGGTTVRTDGASMAAPVLSVPTVGAGASAGPGMVCNYECALIVTKVNFIAFIGKVVNTTRVVESRNARLKVIVALTVIEGTCRSTTSISITSLHAAPTSITSLHAH